MESIISAEIGAMMGFRRERAALGASRQHREMSHSKLGGRCRGRPSAVQLLGVVGEASAAGSPAPGREMDHPCERISTICWGKSVMMPCTPVLIRARIVSSSFTVQMLKATPSDCSLDMLL